MQRTPSGTFPRHEIVPRDHHVEIGKTTYQNNEIVQPHRVLPDIDSRGRVHRHHHTHCASKHKTLPRPKRRTTIYPVDKFLILQLVNIHLLQRRSDSFRESFVVTASLDFL
jgi:hypothetical protein